MAKRKKKKGFAEKHPLIILLTAPISIPVLVVANIWRKSRKSKKKNRVRIPRAIQKMDGYQFEEYVAGKLRSAGYTKVTVTRKSGDFGADILALTPGGIFSGSRKKICFQCKRYNKPVGVKAVQEIAAAKVYYQCEAACVVSASGFTESAEKMAQSVGVILMHVNRWTVTSLLSPDGKKKGARKQR